MNLFLEDLGAVQTNEELRSLQKKFSNYDPSYICQSALIHRKNEREWLEAMWNQYKNYADSHFVADFKRQFAQRSWELYFGSTLLNRGFKLGPNNGIGPDFDVCNKNEERILWIEAVSVEQGLGRDRVPDEINGGIQNVPEEEMMFRISNALDKKFKKYQTELRRGIIRESDPYVIAINRSKIGFLDPAIPLILKVLFAIGHLTLRLRVDGVRQEDPDSFWSVRPLITKQNGKNVPMTFFAEKMHSGISAVVYCTDDILNSPHKEKEMGENFTFIHNPLATNPLPTGLFPFGDEYRVDGEHLSKTHFAKEWNRHDF